MTAPDDDATLRIKAAYDAVDYECSAYPASHPDRLATVATLLGVDPPALSTCRVLEIGCADGTNIIPIAATWPEAVVVGCDLSPRPIEHARRVAQEIGLTNITLLQADIRALPADLGPFDYIIAHGFYSWVPADVREALMALIAARLAPSGVAFVSYNALPGCRVRQIAWDALHFHTDGIADAKGKLDASRTLLRLLAEPQLAHWKPDGQLRDEFANLASRNDSVLLHDDLAVPNDAFYFHEFEAHARRHGLTFLAEAEARFMGGSGLTPAMKRMIAQCDRVTREQYLDFARFRRFRQTLLTKAPSVSNYGFMAGRIAGLQVAAEATLIRSIAEAEQRGQPRASVLSDGEPLVHQLLLWLAELAPRTVSVPDIVAWLARQAPNDRRPIELLLAELYIGGVIELYLQPAALTTNVSERPLASPVARAMARTGMRVVNLRHEMVNLSDPFARRLVPLLDGTRSRRTLQEALGTGYDRGPDGLEAMLRFFGKVSLLQA